MHKGIDRDIAELRSLWPSLDLGSRRPASMPRNLIPAVDRHCRLTGNRDGRGVTSATVAEIRTTLRHIRSAVIKVSSGGTGKAEHAAKKLLKSLHHESSFEGMAELARRYAGTLQKLGKRRARRRAVCPEHSVCLGQAPQLGEVYLDRVVSVSGLMSVGRRLGVCVAHDDNVGRGYHRRLRSGESAFWQVRVEDPLALLEASGGVDGKHGIIEEWNIQADGDLGLPRPMLLHILREVRASGDQVRDFARVGAFWALRRSPPCTHTLTVGHTQYRVWRFAEEVIIRPTAKSPTRRNLKWSRFVRRRIRPWYARARGNPARGGGNRQPRGVGTWTWSAAERTWGMNDQQLLALMLVSPDLYDLLTDA